MNQYNNQLERYLPATLSANEDNITNTFIKNNFCIIPPLSGPPVSIITLPIITKTMEEIINIFVAIFCISILYIYIKSKFLKNYLTNNIKYSSIKSNNK